MVWHLTASFQHAFGELVLPNRSNWFSRRIVRVVALHTAMQWPKGASTSPPLDAQRNPLPVTPFDEDQQRLCDCIARFADAQLDGTRHVFFGPMSQAEWQHWGWRHSDHHFRQFNV
jgi:hypothetical protein